MSACIAMVLEHGVWSSWAYVSLLYDGVLTKRAAKACSVVLVGIPYMIMSDVGICCTCSASKFIEVARGKIIDIIMATHGPHDVSFHLVHFRTSFELHTVAEVWRIVLRERTTTTSPRQCY